VGTVRPEQEQEFCWLFRRSFASVARTVELIVYDRGRAEEIAQDAFARLWKDWDVVGGYERPDAWVRRVAIRMAVRAARRERVRPSLERRARQPVEPALPDPDLAAAVRELAPMQRAAVVLHYLEDRPVTEIADVLRVSESTVKQHLMRARHRLAARLHEEVTEDVR
jgi:RNA polymerase sigma-70 factor (ECF subfamily)